MPDYNFKTIYFPKERVRVETSARISISLPKQPKDNISAAMIAHISKLDSREFRLALGDPFLEDLEKKAVFENRSLSNVCLSILKDRFEDSASDKNISSHQKTLNFEDDSVDKVRPRNGDSAFGVTFKDNLRQGVHGWYPYLEGFSASYARDALLRHGTKPSAVYDPFGGSGTTQLAASLLSIPSFYSELNPFMTFVAKTKVSSAHWARNNYKKTERITNAFLDEIEETNLVKLANNVNLNDYYNAFPNRDFFVEEDLCQLLAAIKVAKELSDGNPHIERILLLACAANVVKCSNMTRRADLRRRRSDEYKTRIVNVSQSITQSLSRMIKDIALLPLSMAPTHFVSADAKHIPEEYQNAFDLVLTSPPYLNGTNYFRNTKLELWIMSLIGSEKDLRKFRALAVTGGINDVSKKDSYSQFSTVETVAEKLDIASKDKRIPTMVRHYFSDMFEVLNGVYKSLIPGGKLLLDIGDSRFYGVHVPTDRLLMDVAQEAGFTISGRHLLAKRMSRDKSDLVQVELVLEKPKNVRKTKVKAVKSVSLLQDRIQEFQHSLPYKSLPYSKKNWGNPLHSLCSYQGKLKPSLAYWLVNKFVKPNSRILDPIGGVGTIAFEGAMAGHEVVSNDKSPFPALIARGKLRPPSISNIEKTVARLKNEITSIELTKTDYASADFGLNATVKDYYHPNTLEELLKLRKIFLTKNLKQRSDSENFVWACLLHILHGNRPYALSRTSHPITPFAPSGPAEYKCPFTKIIERAGRALKAPLPDSFKSGTGIEGDFRNLPDIIDRKFDTIITSPPFYGMRFDRPNWLRLWFCGWDADDFKETSQEFLERQQTKDVAVYNEFFSMCKSLLKKDGLLILHLGSGGRKNLVEEFKQMGVHYFSLEGEVIENVQAIAKHGVNDKGFTKSHSLLFFRQHD